VRGGGDAEDRGAQRRDDDTAEETPPQHQRLTLKLRYR
jgi:hypothetical protein